MMQQYNRSFAAVTSAEEWKEHVVVGKMLSRKVVQAGRVKYQVTFTTEDGVVHKLIAKPVLEFFEVHQAPEL